MATNIRSLSALYILCSILPFLASAFLPEMDQFLPNIPREGVPLSGLVYGNEQKTHSVSYGVDAGALLNDKRATNDQLNLFQDAGPVEDLRLNYYEGSCPRVEQIINEMITNATLKDAGLAAALVRLHAHDCFVRGCDASILLDKNPNGGPVEKTAAPNGAFIRGTEIIDDIKARLESECPGVVSCADVLTYAARDALLLSGLPKYEVPGGRKDGTASVEGEVLASIPVPDNNMDTIIKMFANKGLTPEELVVLTGAHSIGISHCGNFIYRLFNKNITNAMDSRLVSSVGFSCQPPEISTMPFDSITPYKMDAGYYKLLLNKRGLIESDQFMADDPKTSEFVKQFAADENGWFEKFAAAMIKMSKIEVLTGNAGQIRKQCRFVN